MKFTPEIIFLSIILIVVVNIAIAFLFLWRKAKAKIAELKIKISDTGSMIDERLALADKYSKMVSLVANKTVEACIITDKNGKVEWVNTAFTDITGYTLAEVLGKKPGDLLQGAETDKRTIESIRSKLKLKSSFKEEILNYHKTGYKYWLSLSITPVLDSKGEIEKFIAIETDITKRREFEKEMEKKLSTLK